MADPAICTEPAQHHDAADIRTEMAGDGSQFGYPDVVPPEPPDRPLVRMFVVVLLGLVAVIVLAGAFVLVAA